MPDARGDMLWHRAQDAAFKHLLDARYSTAIGRLELRRLLTRSQIEAGVLIASIYGAWERIHGQHRNPSGPGYIRSIVSDQTAGDAVTTTSRDADDEDGYIKRLEKRWCKLNVELEKLPQRGRAVIESLCVDHEDQSDALLPSIRYALDCVAACFDRSKPRPQLPMDMRITSRRPPRRPRDDLARRPLQSREAFVAGMKMANSPLDDAGIEAKWREHLARNDRARFSAEKKRQA